MSMRLAIDGGKPVRPTSARWPHWPQWGARETQFLMETLASSRAGVSTDYEHAFVRAFLEVLSADHGIVVSSGTAALQLGLEACGVGAYDEVIVPALSWQATATAVLDVNAVPVLVDVDSTTWCMSTAAVEGAMTPRTRAIIPVHLYSSVAEMDRISALATEAGAVVIEDAAHQPIGLWRGQSLGTLGKIGCFSFQTSKPLTSGEGGFVVASTRELLEYLYSLRSCGRSLEGSRRTMNSGNYRLGPLQPALLLAGLEKEGTFSVRRKRARRRLEARLAGLAGVRVVGSQEEHRIQTFYKLALQLELGKGWDPERFSSAVNAELGVSDAARGFEPVYRPLTSSPYYQPQSKARHALSKAYLAAVDATRFTVPNADRAYATGVVLDHCALSSEEDLVEDIFYALEKVMAFAGRRS